MKLKIPFINLWIVGLLVLALLVQACGETNDTATSLPAAPTPTISAFAVISGPGSELLGQLFAVGVGDIRVKKVERYPELKDGSVTFAPKAGVFMVVTLEVANLGQKPLSIGDMKLTDSKNQEYTELSGFTSEQIFLQDKLGYTSTIYVNPGLVKNVYRTYDVPKDAAGFKIGPKNTSANSGDRKPATASFANGGGKGPDSGAGPELVGKTITLKTNDGTADIKITKVERLSEVKAASQTIKANGVYLILSYEIKNNGSKDICCQDPDLKDSESRIYTTGNIDVIKAIRDNYKYDDQIKGGQVGYNYSIYEVIKEAKGFELTLPALY